MDVRTVEHQYDRFMNQNGVQVQCTYLSEGRDESRSSTHSVF